MPETSREQERDPIVARDFAAFSERLRQDSPDFFDPAASIFAARAPGRLDVMGGIADYSGSLVAEMPIAQAVVAAAQRDDSRGGGVIVRSGNAESEGFLPETELPPDAFVNPTATLKHVKNGPAEARWAGYVAGTVAVLRAEGMVPRGAGARIYVHSTVPAGAGVASSAALEVASMRAVCAAFGIEMDGLTLARLCQRVENDIMDAPCGIMDQVTSAKGEAGSLLLLLCQPYKIEGAVALPAGWAAFGIDSGVKHSVGGGNYTRARVAAFMGYKILADRAGSGFRGYLANLSPDEYRALMPERLPETTTGSAFRGAHGGIFDSVTTIDPQQTYRVRACAEHAIFENDRVRRFVDLLRKGDDDAMRRAGALMDEAHASYSACDLGSPETDLLAELARQQGGDVAGARITGGGSGGTVAILVRRDAEERVAQAVASEYAARTGNAPRRIHGTSPGAYATPVRKIMLNDQREENQG